MELKLNHSSLPTNVFNCPKHFSLILQKWKLQIQRISWKCQNISKKILVHVVKKGETMNSISQVYGLPIHEIAEANKHIVDFNLVFEGQHLNIPSAIAGYAQMYRSMGAKLQETQLAKPTPILEFYSLWNQVLKVPSTHHLSLVKPTGYLLVLVPLIAFCIRCVICAFQNRIAKNMRDKAGNKYGVHDRPSNHMRWRTVLGELRDPDTPEAEAEPNSNHVSENEEQLHFEEVSQDFAKLEDDYQKFLSECGMSKWGHWRGGSPQ